jgi:hypothetical protein
VETKMIFNGEDYELSSSTEIDMLLIDLPMDLIKENLKAQINDPLTTNVNYIETIIDKIREMQASYGDNDDAVQNINKLIVDFFSFVIIEIDKRFKLGIDVNYDNVEETMETGSVLYYFLILRYKKNITKFLYKYISKNKKKLVEDSESQGKKKDVTTIALKKKMKNKDDISIISNLPNIIKYIMNLDIEPSDFLQYACGSEHYDGVYITNLMNEGSLIGDFVEDYLSIIKNDYDYVLDEIQTEIKFKIINKL